VTLEFKNTPIFIYALNMRTAYPDIYSKYSIINAASEKVYQLPAHVRWFSPGTPDSSTTKTDRHDIAEILLKVALKTINH
jgi:hypothetical protein